MHGPGHDDLPLLLQVTVKYSPSHALSTDPAGCRRPHRLQFLSLDGIRAEIRANVSWTNCHHMDSIALQLHSRCLSESVHCELGRAVGGMKWQRNMSCNAGYVGDR